MIKYFYKSLRSDTIRELTEPKPGTWVHVEAPTQKEIELLVTKFKLDDGYIRDALDEDEVPRLEREDDKSYMFVRYAYENSEGDMDTAPLLIVFDSEFIVTMSLYHLPAIDSLLKSSTPFATTQRTKLILLILGHISDHYDGLISQTSKRIKAIRSRLRNQGITNQDLIDFVTIEDELNEFMASLLPTNAALRRLLAGKQLALFEEDEDIVEDVLLNNEQSIEAIRASLKSVTNIRDAYLAISSNNLNRTITVLTLATILVALPNVFFGMYGMNVQLPEQNAKWTFELIVGINLVLITSIIVYARKKKII